MKTIDIISLDCRLEENKNIIQKVLKQIKPLSKYSDEVPLNKIVKAISVIVNKYNVDIWNIKSDFKAGNEPIFRVEIDIEANLYIHIYGITLYEVLAKTVIKLYSDIKQDKIKIRK